MHVWQIGNERMTLALEWTQQEAYRNEPLTEWLVDGKPAGLTRSGGGLTFATIAGAGHLVSFFELVSSREHSLIEDDRLHTTGRWRRRRW